MKLNPEILQKAAMTLFAWSAAVQDLKKRSISLWSFAVFAGAGFLCMLWSLCLKGDEILLQEFPWGRVFLAFLPGAALYVLAKWSRELIGIGDALYFLTAAFYFSAAELCLIFCMSLLLAAGCGLILFAFRTGDAGKGHCGAIRLPFAVCLLPSVMLVMYGSM